MGRSQELRTAVIIQYKVEYTINNQGWSLNYTSVEGGGGGGGGNIILIIILFTFGFIINTVKNIHYYNIYKFAPSYSLFKAKISYYSFLIRPKPEQNPSSGFAE